MRADALRNRDRIVRAARDLIAQHRTGVPLDDIARRAGVGAGTVHRHFPTKQALLAGILVDVLDQRSAQARHELAQTPDRALELLIEGLLDDGRANVAVKEALAQEGFNLRAVAPDSLQRFDAALENAVEAAKQAGLVRGDLTRDDVAAVIAGALTAQQLAPAGREAFVREIVLRGLGG